MEKIAFIAEGKIQVKVLVGNLSNCNFDPGMVYLSESTLDFRVRKPFLIHDSVPQSKN